MTNNFPQGDDDSVKTSVIAMRISPTESNILSDRFSVWRWLDFPYKDPAPSPVKLFSVEVPEVGNFLLKRLKIGDKERAKRVLYKEVEGLRSIRNVTQDLVPEIVDFRCYRTCLLYTSPSPRDRQKSRMPSSACKKKKKKTKK
eukprot:TRINITY_DN5218_c0_g1_i3.p2 TRINITY_DN5218_c0_g1~~TRINITY_DN5218_c0_g1_i3.p2  ORF type:complete len:143 (+),score=50.74 TRINITY_DN5218_c0_g1_i3:196-624(+)